VKTTLAVPECKQSAGVVKKLVTGWPFLGCLGYKPVAVDAAIFVGIEVAVKGHALQRK
jgi:hypothetical protein